MLLKRRWRELYVTIYDLEPFFTYDVGTCLISIIHVGSVNFLIDIK